MVRLFDITDLHSEETPKRESESNSQRAFTVSDPGTWEMKFEKETVSDLNRLLDLMPRVNKREEVVYTALQILALSVYRDIVIESKYKGEPKKVSGLWDK